MVCREIKLTLNPNNTLYFLFKNTLGHPCKTTADITTTTTVEVVKSVFSGRLSFFILDMKYNFVFSSGRYSIFVYIYVNECLLSFFLTQELKVGWILSIQYVTNFLKNIYLSGPVKSGSAVTSQTTQDWIVQYFCVKCTTVSQRTWPWPSLKPPLIKRWNVWGTTLPYFTGLFFYWYGINTRCSTIMAVYYYHLYL